MILVIDSDRVFGDCIVRTLEKNGFKVRLFGDAISAMGAISEIGAPDLVFLDVMLTGPNGFTFLNEMASYADTFEVPKDFAKFDLKAYGVVGTLDKYVMVPKDVVEYAKKYA